MLIDIKRKIIFVAGLKTGSTSVENMFQHMADIRIVRSEWGKHDAVHQIKQKFAWLFEKIPFDEFFVWGVIREPRDWLWSLYKSHRHENFAADPRLYTGNMNFEEFLDDWCARNFSQVIPQHLKFEDENDNLVCDALIPFERLEEGLKHMAVRYDAGGVVPKKLNASPVIETDESFLAARDQIAERYARDYEIHQWAGDQFEAGVFGSSADFQA
ncbi:hypothetical protein [Altererythrobacter lutimaris]|uniref:Sulfotransferase family protein n=1 Tax=Altererythrobacter lutimaris TaxID=2743979 RepID=A0A850H609_9SPHN|nr:hypothetical protein [Altererythrobacter lutimaris]NVE94577.1 hypothetical protein [Altererythrobacter lutimaris]